MNDKDSADQYRVLRGGAFYNLRDFVCCATRDGYNPNFRDYDLGFRVVLSPVSDL